MNLIIVSVIIQFNLISSAPISSFSFSGHLLVPNLIQNLSQQANSSLKIIDRRVKREEPTEDEVLKVPVPEKYSFERLKEHQMADYDRLSFLLLLGVTGALFGWAAALVKVRSTFGCLEKATILQNFKFHQNTFKHF